MAAEWTADYLQQLLNKNIFNVTSEEVYGDPRLRSTVQLRQLFNAANIPAPGKKATDVSSFMRAVSPLNEEFRQRLIERGTGSNADELVSMAAKMREQQNALSTFMRPSSSASPAAMTGFIKQFFEGDRETFKTIEEEIHKLRPAERREMRRDMQDYLQSTRDVDALMQEIGGLNEKTARESIRSYSQSTVGVDPTGKSAGPIQGPEMIPKAMQRMSAVRRHMYNQIGDEQNLDLKSRLDARHRLLMDDLKKGRQYTKEELDAATPFLKSFNVSSSAADMLSDLIDGSNRPIEDLRELPSLQAQMKKTAWEPGGTKFSGMTNNLKDTATLLSYTKFHGFLPGLTRHIATHGLTTAGLVGMAILATDLMAKGTSMAATGEQAAFASPGGGVFPWQNMFGLGQSAAQFTQTARILGTGTGSATNTRQLNELLTTVKYASGHDFAQLAATMEKLGYSQTAIKGITTMLATGAGTGTPGQAQDLAQFVAETGSNWNAGQFATQTNRMGAVAGSQRLNAASAGLINAPMNLFTFATINGRNSEDYRKNPALLRADFAKAVSAGGMFGELNADVAAGIMNSLGIAGNGNQIDFLRSNSQAIQGAANLSDTGIASDAQREKTLRYQAAIGRLANTEEKNPLGGVKTFLGNIFNPDVMGPLGGHYDDQRVEFANNESQWVTEKITGLLDNIRGNTGNVSQPIQARRNDDYITPIATPSSTPPVGQ